MVGGRERSNTSEEVIARIIELNDGKGVKLFSEMYRIRRAKHFARILGKEDSDPSKFATFDDTENIWDYPEKRQFGPEIK